MMLLLLALAFLFALIAWKNLPLAIYILLALLPSYLLRTDLFGIPTTLLELMLLMTVGVWLIQNRHRTRELFALDKRFAIAIALLIVSATISATIAPNAFGALGIWKAYFIEPILFFYLLKDLLKRGSITPALIIRSLIISGIWVSLFALVQWVLQTGIPIPWDIERRVTGVFDYPNALGLYLGPLAVMALGSSAGAQDDKKIKLGMTGVLFTLAILLAQSEAALAALVVTIILMGLSHPIWRKKTALLVIVAAIIFSLIPSTRSYLSEKITLQDYSGQVRVSQWQETWALIKDHPVLGVGLSGYPSAFVPYHQATHIEIFQYPHNIFLNIWVELGLLGLVAFFLLAFLLIQSGGVWGPRLLPITFALFPLLHMFIQGLVDVPYFKNDLAMLTWVFIAILYARHFSKTKTHV